MASNSTLFITGAGAHIPYGFPSGKKLITDIIYGVTDDKYAKQILGLGKNLESLITDDYRIIDRGLLNRFISQLSESGQTSIDKFLSLDTVSEDVGKILLMVILSIYEHQNNPHGKNYSADHFEDLRQQSIYHVIVDTLDIVNEGQINDSIRYITFNYDRCLEYFLFKTFLHSYGIKFPQSYEYLDEKIIHVHGSIGNFRPPSMNDVNERIEYGSKRIMDQNDPYIHGLTGYIDNFQTAFNSNYQEKKEKIADFIKAADEIVFLGFAYAEENLKALSLDKSNVYENKNVYCCTYGLTGRKVRNLEYKFQNIFKKSRIIIEDTRNKDGATFLREHWVM